MRTLVTGPTGFVGTGLIRHLTADPAHHVVAAGRGKTIRPHERVQAIHVGDLGAETEWRAALAGVGTVIHLAARAHVMRDTADDPLAAFRQANFEGSVRLGTQAAEAGVRRFVYVSSIKVNGEASIVGLPFRPEDAPQPQDPYGISKLEAEIALRRIAAATGMELVVVRPPLVYGPGVRANFRSMMGWLRRGIPLPFGAIDNRRSLVALDNLCDLLVTCTHHPGAAGQTFLASDGEDVSTTQLLRRLGTALGHPSRLVPLPPAALRAVFGALGKADIAQRLLSSLQVDISAARTRLGWQPPISLDEGLRRAAAAFLAETAR